MRSYTVWSYDIWGNEKDGFEVNDRFKEYDNLVLKDLDDRTIVEALKDHRILAKYCQLRWLDIHGDEYTIYIDQKRNSYPLFELNLNKE